MKSPKDGNFAGFKNHQCEIDMNEVGEQAVLILIQSYSGTITSVIITFIAS